ncbi:transposon-transfer assisting family protein [Hespellia stercorisuis]|uniref:Putative tranposon-transfer assisting protein n=1 Tax=Hespellia stercorisuis DSM 15480 TaxID=1121950 RepID=A0A1M6QUB7_9FIRM|nr:transposon-transfer assisting family protein [Hespellia stercorisuis]SHK23710.1 Putative tranposon-transfer assisting protein [Hespellia stercorisuis DSM 15480]
MMKITFEENEYLVLAMFDAGNRQTTQDRITEILPHVEDDEEVYALAISTIEKLKRISDMEYHKIDLEEFKQNAEDEE